METIFSIDRSKLTPRGRRAFWLRIISGLFGVSGSLGIFFLQPVSNLWRAVDSITAVIGFLFLTIFSVVMKYEKQ